MPGRSYLGRRGRLLFMHYQIIFSLFLLVLGFVVGSFLGMLVFRVPRGMSILGRSFCDHCREPIPWYQNIPVFYYLFSRGRTSCCRKSISTTYPFIEGLTGVSFVLVGSVFTRILPENGLAYVLTERLGVFSLFFFLFLTATFIALLLIDYEFQVLPDEVVLPLGIVVVLALLGLPSPGFFVNLFWGFLSFLFFLSIYLLTGGRGMGFGDVKLSFVLGTLLGFPGTPVWLFLSFLTGAAGGAVLMLLGKARFGKPVPFGPYLLVSAAASLFYAELIWEWYMSLL